MDTEEKLKNLEGALNFLDQRIEQIEKTITMIIRNMEAIYELRDRIKKNNSILEKNAKKHAKILDDINEKVALFDTRVTNIEEHLNSRIGAS